MAADPVSGLVEGMQSVRFVPDLPVDRVVLRLWANGPALGDDALVDCALAHYVAGNAWSIATPQDLWRSLDATFADWRPVLAPAGLAPG